MFVCKFAEILIYGIMITQAQLDDLAAKISTLACPCCGESQRMVLKLVHSSSIDRPVVTFGFPDHDTCEDFKMKARDFASRFIQSMIVGPNPLDLM